MLVKAPSLKTITKEVVILYLIEIIKLKSYRVVSYQPQLVIVYTHYQIKYLVWPLPYKASLRDI